MNYWKECIAEAFEDAGITATDEQINTVTSWAEGAHDNYSTARGYDCIPSQASLENTELKRELDKEKSKVICKECGGKGEIVMPGPYHCGISQCSKCHGEGRHIL